MRSAPPTSPLESQRPLGAVLSLLGRGVLSFHPRLVALSGGVSSALILAQSLYWTRILAKREPDRDGWFWKTREEWTAETTLSRHEQGTARARLAKTAFWQEERRGMPARLWYRIDLDALGLALDREFAGHWDWDDADRLYHLLGRPMVVYRALAQACNSVTSGILLSRLLQDLRAIERRAALNGGCGSHLDLSAWQPFSPSSLQAATGLSRSEFYHARGVLRDAGFVSDRLDGVPPRAEWQLHPDALIDCLRGLQPTCDRPETPVVDQMSGFDIPSCPDSGHKSAESTIQACGFPQTGIQECGQQEIRKSDNKMAGLLRPSCPDSGFPYTQLTTSSLITSLPPPPPPAEATIRATAAAVGGGSDDLIWPQKGLLPDEINAGLKLLEPVMPQAQVLIDELAGQLAKGLVRQPLPYLRRLVHQAQTGAFVPLVAARIAAQRKRTARLSARRTCSADSAVALSDTQRADRQAELSALRRSLSAAAAVAPRAPSRSPDT